MVRRLPLRYLKLWLLQLWCRKLRHLLLKRLCSRKLRGILLLGRKRRRCKRLKEVDCVCKFVVRIVRYSSASALESLLALCWICMLPSSLLTSTSYVAVPAANAFLLISLSSVLPGRCALMVRGSVPMSWQLGCRQALTLWLDAITCDIHYAMPNAGFIIQSNAPSLPVTRGPH